MILHDNSISSRNGFDMADRLDQFIVFYICSLRRNLYGGFDLTNMFKICTKLEPTTTMRKNPIRILLVGNSSRRSDDFPTGTLPRLVMFLSNFSFRLRRLRGTGLQCHTIP